MPKITQKIVAIGGVNLRTLSTLPIDREIVRLTGKKHPKFLFIPTASSDRKSYVRKMEEIYGKKLGCITDALLLLKEKPSFDEIKKKILSADIIYVGGGNTLKMMKRWRHLGVDKLLKTAWRKGTVMCGVSAGSICWFESGHSDSMSFYHPKKWEYIRVRGLGFLKGIHCPHYNSGTLGVLRKDYFRRMIEKTGGLGIAIDNSCAIEFLDDQIHVVRSKPNANAYKVFKKNGKVISQKIIEKYS